MENYICFKCQKLCPYNNILDSTKYKKTIPILIGNFQIVPPCGNINKNFFGIKNRDVQAYYNNMKVPYLIDAIEFIINEKNTSLEDTLKLIKIKSQLQ